MNFFLLLSAIILICSSSTFKESGRNVCRKGKTISSIKLLENNIFGRSLATHSIEIDCKRFQKSKCIKKCYWGHKMCKSEKKWKSLRTSVYLTGYKAKLNGLRMNKHFSRGKAYCCISKDNIRMRKCRWKELEANLLFELKDEQVLRDIAVSSNRLGSLTVKVEICHPKITNHGCMAGKNVMNNNKQGKRGYQGQKIHETKISDQKALTQKLNDIAALSVGLSVGLGVGIGVGVGVPLGLASTAIFTPSFGMVRPGNTINITCTGTANAVDWLVEKNLGSTVFYPPGPTVMCEASNKWSFNSDLLFTGYTATYGCIFVDNWL